MEVSEAAENKESIKVDEIQEALRFETDKSLSIVGLPFNCYFRLSHMFIAWLAVIFNNWKWEYSPTFHQWYDKVAMQE